MNKLITISLFVLILVLLAGCQVLKINWTPVTEKRNNEFIYLDCSSSSFGLYEPKIPHSMNDIPDSIRTKLVKHLVNRLGLDYYSRLKLSGGQIVDLDTLYKVEKNAKYYEWIPYSYYLCFSFQDTSKQIGLYTAKIILDKFGNVVQEIELPDIRNFPSKTSLITSSNAKFIASGMKCYDKKTIIHLSYNKEKGSIVWLFYNDHEVSEVKVISALVIDAHNGDIICTP